RRVVDLKTIDEQQRHRGGEQSFELGASGPIRQKHNTLRIRCIGDRTKCRLRASSDRNTAILKSLDNLASLRAFAKFLRNETLAHSKLRPQSLVCEPKSLDKYHRAVAAIADLSRGL